MSAPIAKRLDQLLLRMTGGRHTLSGVLTGIPTVQLATIGAKSGQSGTVMVLGLPHREGRALIASNFGRAIHPAWYHNLRANPEAAVTVNGEAWPVLARLASPRPTSATRSGPPAWR